VCCLCLPESYGAKVKDLRPYGVWALILIVVLVGVRTVGLAFSPLELHGDEAQYYAWSRDLAGGYFSKPPLIGWVIRGATEVFGTGEWAIRMWSPIAHGLAAGFLFGAGRRLFDAQIGVWAVVAYLTLPGIVVSSGIASTDALLLMWVALALWAWAELRAGGGWRWALVFGIALGLGLMSKYAIVFIIAGFGLIWAIDKPTRAAIGYGRKAVIGALVMLIVSPNIIWNLQHDFATASHTVANANLHAELLNPLEGLEFLGSQFGVMGPVLFVLLMGAVWKGWLKPETRALAVLAALPLLVILSQAFLSRANANWAASAYVPGTLLVVAVWLRQGRWDWLRAGIGLNAMVAVMVTVLSLSPALTDAAGLANSVKRVRGWDDTVQALAMKVEAYEPKSIAVDNRITFYALDYYGLGDIAPLYAWQMEARPHHHAELTRPLLEGVAEPILFVNYHEEHMERVRADFAQVERLEPLRVDLGGGIVRELDLYLMRGYERIERK